MKNKITYVFWGLVLAVCLLQSSSQGRANAANSGNTGAPGESTTCITCHGTNADVQVDLNIEAKDADGEVVTEYEPEATYNLTVTIDATMGSPAAYGFQMVSINAPVDVDGDAINDWVNVSDNARIIHLPANNRTYVEHKGPSNTNEFTVQWKAPGAGAGVVTFYACGNGVNLGGSTAGDNAACHTLVFSERIVSHTQDLANRMDISVAPNPAHDFIQVFSHLVSSGQYSIRIYSMNGQLMQEQYKDLPGGEQKTSLDISQLVRGTYIIRIGSRNEAVNLKFVKL